MPAVDVQMVAAAIDLCARVKRTLFACFLMCLLSGTAAADEKIRFGEKNEEAHRTAAFNRAVGALPIDPVDGDQVRAWFFAYWSGKIQVTGYIVTRKGAWRCTLTYTHRASDIVVHRGGSCSGPRRFPERIDKVMALMGDAAKFDGEGVRCQVMDGGGANVEGIFEGKPFAFVASNTGHCADTNPEAARANQLLDLVAAAYDDEE